MTVEDEGRRLLGLADIEVGGTKPWDIHIHDERFWSRVLRDRELGLGESYQDGWWTSKRVDEMLTRLITGGIYDELKPSLGAMKLTLSSFVHNRQSVRRAAKNASAHYNIGNELYGAMLDKRMIYSCAYWARATNLDEAQEHKLDLICQKLELEPSMKLLEIGCGWGGFAQFAAERYGVHVTAISPASEQVRLARQRCEGLDVDILEADYRQVRGKFDRIVSVGMLEHVGPRNYYEFFGTCDRSLTQDGMMLHQSITNTVSKNRSDPWLDKYVFPGGVLPSLKQLATATEGRFIIEDLHNFGPDYDRTLMSWLHNIELHWDQLPDFDERFRRTWRYYLMGSAASFRARSVQLMQLVMRRPKVRSDTYPGYR